jgi:hypothetical protein
MSEKSLCQHNIFNEIVRGSNRRNEFFPPPNKGSGSDKHTGEERDKKIVHHSIHETKSRRHMSYFCVCVCAGVLADSNVAQYSTNWMGR